MALHPRVDTVCPPGPAHGGRLVAALLLAALVAVPAAAQQPAAPSNFPVPAAPEARLQLTEADVSAFLDGLVPLQIERNDIAGAVVVVVKDGQVLFAKGYGYADRAKRTPVSAGDTLFRVGSISKLFTWTAVMQLVEQGKIDLDHDIGTYLDFPIPTDGLRPITMRDLMTHTPGFEETLRELFVADTQHMMPLGDYLRSHLPARIFPPGKVPAYSNYGAALAGYIVQRVSGEPFDDYVRGHIFQPLGMAHSTFVQPLPKGLQPLMSPGYKLGSGEARRFELVVPAPAGALSTSGLDVARFMIAHLQNGAIDGRRILQPATAQAMHARQFGLLPQMNGMALGFYESSRNGHRIIGHGGDTMWFHSELYLVPDQHLGFFISANSAGRGGVDPRAAVWEKFLDRYDPYTPPAATAPATKVADARTVSGSYLTSRRSQTNVLYLMSVLTEPDITAHDDGTIETIIKGFNGQPKKFEEIAPLLYRAVGGQDMLGFVREPGGGLTLAVDFPAIAFQSVPWYERRLTVLVLLVSAIAIPALTLLAWLVTGLARWHYGRRLKLESADRALRITTRLVCGLVLAAVGAWAGVFIYGTADITRLTTGLDPWIHLAEGLTMAGMLATLVPLVNAARMWRRRRWWWSKVWETLVAVACLAFVWIAVLGNFWVWNVKY